GLRFAAAYLTVSQPQLLLAVPIEGLSTCPPMAIHYNYTNHFPFQTVTHQGLSRCLVASLAPKQQDPHGVRHSGNPHLFTEVPILRAPHPHRFFRFPRHLPHYVLELLLLPRIHDLAVELQVAHIRALRALDVVEDIGAG